jgi:hypothetical protein
MRRSAPAQENPSSFHRTGRAQNACNRPLPGFCRGEISENFAMSVPPQDRARFERLRALTPLDAVRAFLEGDFGLGDEPAIIEAIQRDSRVSLSDDEVMESLCEAMDEEEAPEACLERMSQT